MTQPFPFFAQSGQGARDLEFNTVLSPEQEALFQATRPMFFPLDSGFDYDQRLAVLAGFKPDGRGHFPDFAKKPNHQSFSNFAVLANRFPSRAGQFFNNFFLAPGGLMDPRTGIR